jgi:hypothetical protein
MADKYILSVTAGPNYTDQKPIPINTEQPTHIDSPHCSANITARVQNYRGLPASSPKTSPYFSHPSHTADLYSLAFDFTPKRDISGHDLVFGNDFDHPIKDKLPPGFNQAFNLVKWFIDPGLYGDVYSDEPYLYGPLLSSMNTLRIGPKGDRAQERVEEERKDEGLVVYEEGADGDGADVRVEKKMPETGAARKKHFLTEANLKEFVFEEGRSYCNDFYNPYLDFNGEFLGLGEGVAVLDGREEELEEDGETNKTTNDDTEESRCADQVFLHDDRLRPPPPRLRSHPRHHNPHYQLLGRPTTSVSLSCLLLSLFQIPSPKKPTRARTRQANF